MTVKAITGATLETVSGPRFHRGRILIEGSRIAALGDETLTIPSDAQVIDAEGCHVVPGFVDAHVHIASSPYSFPASMSDDNERSDPLTPACRIVDGLFPGDEALELAIKGGVTCGQCLPGSANVIGGTGAVIKLHGTVIDRMVLRAPSAMKAALGENPIRVYGSANKAPATRMGAAALMRQCLAKAQDYREKVKRSGAEGKVADRDLAMEALAMVLDRQIPLRVHSHRADDICTAIRIAEEFGLDYTIEHCTEGHLIAGYLAEKGVWASVGPTFGGKGKIELKNKSWETPLALYRAGVHFCIITDHPVTPLEHFNVAPCLAVRNGLPREAALRAVTLSGAEHLGVAHRVGSLEAGKDADLAIWDGDPLDLRSQCLATFIDGQAVHNCLERHPS